MDDTQIIFEGRPSWMNYILLLAIAILLLLGSFAAGGLFVFALICVIIVVVKRMGCYAKVTKSRIITKFGIFNTKTFEIEIKDIRSINVSQSLLQKIFGLGDLEFASASGSVKEAAIIGIDNPSGLKEQIRSLKITE
jgi:uncharacterized membrane protein YdbT with pleckstrin-like domain